MASPTALHQRALHGKASCLPARPRALRVSPSLVFRSQPISHSQQQPAVRVAEPRQVDAAAIAPGSRRRVQTAAAAGAAGAGAAEPEGQNANQWLLLAGLAALFIGWYGSNIYFNIFAKQLTKVFPYPLTMTCIQFAIGGCLSLLFWATGFVPKPKLNMEVVRSIYPLAMIHVLGNVLTNVSLGAVAVSFVHTVKAMEPFFSVIMSAIFLGDVPKVPVLLSLVPIVAGVILASVTEVTFNWLGFLSAMASNITFQSRNVLSKKLMLKKGDNNSMNIFQIITIMAFFMLAPVALVVEGPQFLPHMLAERGLGEVMQGQIYGWMLMAGLCFHAYQQLSYMILSRVAPVTHSIGNCVKRVVVIVSSVIIFQNPMSTQNMLGTALALSGVFLYSQMKRRYK